ncbi:MAG: zinc ribbon domain-containing protein [Thermoplasmata archaeon]
MAPSFCTRCGQPIPPTARFCVRCGSPAPGAALLSSGGPAAPPPLYLAPGSPGPGVVGVGYPGAPPPVPRRANLRPLWIILGVVAVIVVVLVALFTIPVSHAYSTEIASATGAPATQELSFPSGASVSGSWSTGDGAKVLFEITGFPGTFYSADAASGSFSFTSEFGFYVFEANGSAAFTVNVSGSYSAPYL